MPIRKQSRPGDRQRVEAGRADVVEHGPPADPPRLGSRAKPARATSPTNASISTKRLPPRPGEHGRSARGGDGAAAPRRHAPARRRSRRPSRAAPRARGAARAARRGLRRARALAGSAAGATRRRCPSRSRPSRRARSPRPRARRRARADRSSFAMRPTVQAPTQRTPPAVTSTSASASGSGGDPDGRRSPICTRVSLAVIPAIGVHASSAGLAKAQLRELRAQRRCPARAARRSARTAGRSQRSTRAPRSRSARRAAGGSAGPRWRATVSIVTPQSARLWATAAATA